MLVICSPMEPDKLLIILFLGALKQRTISGYFDGRISRALVYFWGLVRFVNGYTTTCRLAVHKFVRNFLV
jgi:hypothetical protein